jgi:hypothetical protein
VPCFDIHLAEKRWLISSVRFSISVVFVVSVMLSLIRSVACVILVSIFVSFRLCCSSKMSSCLQAASLDACTQRLRRSSSSMMWQSVVLFRLLGSVPYVLWVVRFSSVVFVLICFSFRLFKV